MIEQSITHKSQSISLIGYTNFFYQQWKAPFLQRPEAIFAPHILSQS